MMAQFVKLGKRRINLDAVAFVSEISSGGATVYFNAGADEDGTLPFLRVTEQEKIYLLHILDWLDATPVSVSLDGIVATITKKPEGVQP